MRDWVKGAIAFARESFRNDGAEGETVWLLCAELEAAEGRCDESVFAERRLVAQFLRERAGWLDREVRGGGNRVLFEKAEECCVIAEMIMIGRHTRHGDPMMRRDPAPEERPLTARSVGAERRIAELEQRVCDFQAALMIEVGGVGGPCMVEPRHVEAHVTTLERERDEALARIADLERQLGERFDEPGGSAWP